MGLDGFLESQRRQGQLDSQGVFTTRWDLAARKLRDYQLVNPFHYVLRLVRAAVFAGAGQIDITTTLDATRVEFDACLGGRAQLAELLQYLLHRGRDRALHELAVGLNAAQATRPHQLLVECGEHGEVHCLRLGRSEGLESRSGEARAFTRVELVRKSSRGFISRLGACFTGFSPEAELLRRRCQFCPIPMRINGRWLRRGGRFGRSRHSLQRRLAPSDRYQDRFFLKPQGEGPGLAVFALGLGRPDWRAADVMFLDGGVAICRKAIELEVAGVDALVTCRGLNLDLSGERVVEDQMYSIFVDWLGGQAEQARCRANRG